MSATKRFRQRGKNKTKSNDNDDIMRMCLLCMKKVWSSVEKKIKNVVNKLRGLILHFWDIQQKKWSKRLECSLMKKQKQFKILERRNTAN